MIRWLKNLFARRDGFGYKPNDKRIFPYFDGTRWRKGDPLVLHRALLENKSTELAFDPGVAAIPNLEGMKAVGRLAKAVRESFDVPPVEKGGLTEIECLLLFAEFGKFIQQLREDAGPLAYSPGPSPASAAKDSPIPNLSAFGKPPAGPAATPPPSESTISSDY